MSEIEIIDKIRENVYVIRLNTGEYLVGIIANEQENIIVVSLPYLIENKTITEEFLEISANKNYFFNRYSIQYIKKPKKEFINKYLDVLIKKDFNELQLFIKNYINNILDEQNENDIKSDRILH